MRARAPEPSPAGLAFLHLRPEAFCLYNRQAVQGIVCPEHYEMGAGDARTRQRGRGADQVPEKPAAKVPGAAQSPALLAHLQVLRAVGVVTTLAVESISALRFVERMFVAEGCMLR